MVDLATAYMKNGFYAEYESSLRHPRPDGFTRTPWDEIWVKYKPRVVEGASQFDEVSIDQVRTHFKAWATEQNMLDRFPSYRMFIGIDEENFQTQNAPLPGGRPQTLKDSRRHYVKVVEELEEDPEPPCPG
ncbi:uncharacterized protein PGRI_023140 [Penicillium griseofulvum]|uniref:Uncharacterized protein n=1 Tax=Penicillium patulum TaxID=5078 RepID=A0A135LHJ3_PENPA|nr:uncharacterized protein PGRI_023140 [Penicillium griseofulvum]KXG48444.1 hypothetical protein PGRI_023140 [Penicillium griseofulvum]